MAADREDLEKKALDELKQHIRTALNKRQFSSPTLSAPTPTPTPKKKKNLDKLKQLSLVTKPTPKVKATQTPKVKATQTPNPVVIPLETEPAVVIPPEIEPVVDDGVGVGVGVSSEISETQLEDEVVYIYGVPLLRDERSDVILLKFLRARDFKVNEAFTMIKKTVLWRQKFGIDALLDEKEKKGLGRYLEGMVFIYGCDREGRPVCYYVCGEFHDKDLYVFTFSDEGKRKRFIRWMVIFMEKVTRKLDFSPDGISTIVQIIDMNHFPGIGKEEFHQATDEARHLIQDYYPGFIAKQVLINAPWWFCAFQRIIKHKHICALASNSAETLFKYINPNQVPVRYGGLIKEGEMGFCSTDQLHEIKIKPGVKQTIEVSVPEGCVLVWEVRVICGEVHYDADFVPSAEDGYRVPVSKTKVILSSSDLLAQKKRSSLLLSNKKRSSTADDEPGICNSFKMTEPGKIVISIGNFSVRKKKILLRFRANH